MKIKIGFLLGFCSLIFTFCELQKPQRQGAQLYNAYCSNCHMENGQGFKSLYPPLAHSDFLVENQDRIACILRQGIEGEITVNGKVYDHPMAGIPNLNPVEIHNIVNYINSSWGNKTKTLTINEIKKQLTECETE